MHNQAASCAAVLLALLAACGDTPTNSNVRLVASPGAVAVSDTAAPATVFLTTEPSGRINWQVASKPEWLIVTPSSGAIDGRMVEVRLSVSPDAVMTGQIGGALEIVSDGGAATVQVLATISARPVAAVTAAATIGDAIDTTSFTLRNTGRGVLHWDAAPSAAWLDIAPAGGSLDAGAEVRVLVTADKQPLVVGTTNASVAITSNSVDGSVTVPVSVSVPATPQVAVSAARVSLPPGESEATFTLANTGKGTLTWSVVPAAAWITVSPSSGQTAPAGSEVITVTVDRQALGNIDGFSSVTVQSNAPGGAVAVAVAAGSQVPDANGVFSLDHRVIDAEFSMSAGIVATVSANPSRLNLIDVIAGTVQHVDLSRPPTSLSIRPDGNYVAVGHDGAVSYVNLATLAVERVYNVSTETLDVVLAGNGWAYVFPVRDQWQNIHSLQLATGLELRQGGLIYAGTVGRLHPSGDYMYTADNNLSPSDFQKVDIRQGPATAMYDSPYHGDYEFSGDVWISTDGSRLYARSGNVFRSSPVQNQDMLYMGRLLGTTRVQWASDSDVTQRAYVLAEGGGLGLGEVRVYDTNTLSYLGSVQLPAFTGSNAEQFAAEGRFVFIDGAGGTVFVLQQAESASGLNMDWGIVQMPASDFP